MARRSLTLVAVLGLALSACGKAEDDANKPKTPSQTPSASAPSSPKPGDAPKPGDPKPGDTKPGASQSWTGTIQPAEVGAKTIPIGLGGRDPAARLRHPNHLGHCLLRSIQVLKDALNPGGIERSVRKRESHGIPNMVVNCQLSVRCPCVGYTQHRFAVVTSRHATTRAHDWRRIAREVAGTAPDVEQ